MRNKLQTGTISSFSKGVLASYSQIFFSENKLFGGLLLIVTFIHPLAGLAGLLAVIASQVAANIIGYDSRLAGKGFYGFNSLLTALCMGISFEPSPILLFLILITSVFVVLITAAIQGILTRQNLPFLSIPFLLSVWLVILATRSFGALEINQKTIYFLNELYKYGGNQLIRLYEISNNLPIPISLKIYLESLGAIFFQYNLLAGILIAAGLLFYSRIAFSLSILGFYSAWFFYKVIGADISSLGYSYIGFNYILTAVAIGGYFYVPSIHSYSWAMVLTPLVAIVSLGFQNALNLLHLPIYSLPFNLIVLLFLFAFRFRNLSQTKIREVPIQRHTPEENLYSTRVSLERFRYSHLIPIRLPFWGEWTVSQGHDGIHTHKEDWKFAWDFVITDSENKQFSGKGLETEDYYCFGKPVIAPADGEIASIEDGIDDNPPGKINLVKNWGNTVVIKHGPNLFSQLSHLKKGSLKIKPGEQVKAGQIIGACGNSGRSPYPHLHFQLQSTPYIGSKTIEYPISYYIVRNRNNKVLEQFNTPKENEIISNPDIHPLLKKHFDLIPGKKIKVTFSFGNKEIAATWEVCTTMYNELYLWSPEDKSAAYFITNGIFFRFVHFEGKKKSLLYYFYLAFYELMLGADQEIAIKSEIPAYQIFKPHELFLQDGIAPFYQFMCARYNLKYKTENPVLSADKICLLSEVVKEYAFKRSKRIRFESTLLQDESLKIIVYEE